MSLKDLLDAARRRLGLADSTPEFDQAPREHIHLTNPWHAVAIQPGPKRCKSVEALAGNRYLSNDAPKLPLRDCTEPQCSCRYRHYEDRRHASVALDANGMPLPNPRRRNTD
jgi:hypothetical protein